MNVPELKNLHKPSLEERKTFLLKIMSIYGINKTAGIELLSQSCGTRYNTVKKWFYPESSKSASDCPPACWRCWIEDFQEVGLS